MINEAIRAEARKDIAERGEVRETWYYAEKFYGPFEDATERHRAIDRVGKVLNRMKFEIPPKKENKPDDDMSFEEIVLGLCDAKKLQDRMEPRPCSLEVDAGTDPSLQLFIADGHFGNRGCDMKQLHTDTKLIEVSRFAKVNFVGDMYDNWTNNRLTARGINDALIGPSLQLKMFLRWVHELHTRDQLTSIGLGNHTVDREEKAIGYPLVPRMVLPDIAKKVFQGMGEIKLYVGNEEYRILLSHKGLGNSATNPVHGAVKLQIKDGYPDAVVIAHYHSPAFMDYHGNNKQLVAMRTGTYLVGDPHSERYYNRLGGVLGVPAIIFMPDTHEMIPFRNFSRAIQMYKAIMGWK